MTVEKDKLIASKYRVLAPVELELLGDFYEAENAHTGRTVLLRIFEKNAEIDAEVMDEVSRHVRALVTSRCDHLVQILDMEIPKGKDDPLVVVMESTRGERLSEVLAKGTPFDIPQAVKITLEVLEAITSAHSKKVNPLGATEGDVFLTHWAGQRNFVKLLSPNVAASLNESTKTVDIEMAGKVLWRALTAAHPDACPGDPAGAHKLLEALTHAEEKDSEALQALAHVCVKALHGGYPSPDEMILELEGTELAEGVEGEQSVSFESLPDAAFSRPDPLPESQPTMVDRKAVSPEASPRLSTPPKVPTPVSESSLPWRWLIPALFGVVLGVAATLTIQHLLFQKHPSQKRHPKSARKKAQKQKAPSVPPERLKGPPLKFAIAYYSEAPKFKSQMKTLKRYLQKRLKQRIDLIALHHETVGKRLEDGTVQLAVFSPYLYVITKKEFSDIEVLVTHLAYGSVTYEGYIVVGDTSPIRSIKDLKGRSVCFVNKTSGSGYLFPQAVMKKNGIDPSRDFSKTLFTQSHTRSIQYVLEGKCAAAAVASVSYLNAVVNGTAALRILPSVTDLIPGDAYCVSPKLPKATLKKLKRAFVTFDPQRDLNKKYLGKLHRITGFVSIDDTHYDSIRKVWRTLQKGNSNHPPKSR